MSQALYRKWRPSQWDQVVGQEHIIQTLRNQAGAGTIRHAYLFAGPRGTGKTTTARLLAKVLNCELQDPAGRPCNQCPPCIEINKGSYLDVIEIDAASNTSVEDVRDLRDKISFAPSNPHGNKVYIIDEVHMLSNPAFNALLKTLEEPPPRVYFILATTDIGKIPLTILSRCQRHEFRSIPVSEIIQVLKKIAAEEGLDVEDAALRAIARQASGALRDAISLLDQLASSGSAVTLEKTVQVLGNAGAAVACEVVDAVIHRDSASGLSAIAQALDAGSDPRQLARQMVEYLRGLLMIQLGGGSQLDETPDALQEMTRQAGQIPPAQLVDILGLFNSAASSDRASAWHPGLLLEMAFARALGLESPAREPAPGMISARASAAPAHPPQPARPDSSPPPFNRQPAQAAVPQSSASTESRAPAAQPARPAAAREQAPAGPPLDGDQAGHAFQLVRENWPKVRALIKRQSPQTEALLNSGKLLGIKNGALLVGLSPALKAMLEKEEKLEISSKAIQAVTGLSLKVQVTEQASRTARLPADLQVEDDGVVGTAMRDLGGEVVDIQ